MPDAHALYEQVILDHNKKPRNFGALTGADRRVEGYNPLCGDQFTFFVKMDGDTIAAVTFDGAGCAISKASASIMSVVVQGKTRREAQALFARFHAMLTAPPDAPVDEAGLGELRVFGGVRAYPVRVKCATLPWHALHAALEGIEARVTTE